MVTYEVPPEIEFETKELQIGNYSLTYWEEGAENKGKRPTLYFLHGWTGDIMDHYWQIEHFRPRFHCMAHNHRNHGTSTFRDEPVTMKDLAEDFYQILQQKDIPKIILIGHSMGTFVSLEFTLAHQDLLTALVLIGGSSRYNVPSHVNDMVSKVTSTYDLQMIISKMFDIPLRKRPKELKEFYAKLHKWEMDRKKTLPIYTSTRFFEALQNYDLTDRLPEIKVPTLLMYGEKDTLVDQEENSAVLTAIPNSKLVIIEGSGHSPTREQIDLANAKLEEFFNQFI